MTIRKIATPRKMLKTLAVTTAGLATGVMAAPHVGLPDLFRDAVIGAEARDVATALKLRLPRTKIDAVDCAAIAGLCEVNAGGTLFYVDKSARYLVVGRIYDMETRQDLTAARLLELNPDLIAAGAAKAARAADDEEHEPPKPAKPARVRFDRLTPNGAIHWGPANGPRVIVLSDFHCSYCKKLEGELAQLGAHVEERPISVLGKDSRALAEAVLCASNPAQAVTLAYQGVKLRKARACDTTGLDANEAFARAHGFSGTPVIIRPDGAVLEGYRPASLIAQFLGAGAAKPQAKGN
jgi:thiol:disulfide interchange protein DsbC